MRAASTRHDNLRGSLQRDHQLNFQLTPPRTMFSVNVTAPVPQMLAAAVDEHVTWPKSTKSILAVQWSARATSTPPPAVHPGETLLTEATSVSPNAKPPVP